MPTRKNPFDRFQTVIKTLQVLHPLHYKSVADLHTQLQVTAGYNKCHRTLQRDLKQLVELGLVETKNGLPVGYRRSKNFPQELLTMIATLATMGRVKELQAALEAERHMHEVTTKNLKTATTTLFHYGYTYHGGEVWKPQKPRSTA